MSASTIPIPFYSVLFFFPHFFGPEALALVLSQTRPIGKQGTAWQKQSGWTVRRVWMAHSTTHSGNRPNRSLIFGSASPTKVRRQPRRRKYAFSTRATPY